MDWGKSSCVFEIETWANKMQFNYVQEKKVDDALYHLLASNKSVVFMMRGSNRQSEKSLSQYERYVNRFSHSAILHGIQVFIIVLRNLYDIAAAETVLQLKRKHTNAYFVAISLGEEYYDLFPLSTRAKIKQIFENADFIKDTIDEQDTIAEEFALTLAESMLYVYEKDHEHNEWSDFIPNSIRLTMDCDSCYRLRKIWIISLSDN